LDSRIPPIVGPCCFRHFPHRRFRCPPVRPLPRGPAARGGGAGKHRTGAAPGRGRTPAGRRTSDPAVLPHVPRPSSHGAHAPPPPYASRRERRRRPTDPTTGQGGWPPTARPVPSPCPPCSLSV